MPDGAGGGGDLGDRAASGLRIDDARYVRQRPQGHQQTGGLGRGEFERLVDACREGDLDGVAGELEIDEIARVVAR